MMRKSSASKLSGIPVSSVLRPRNQGDTPLLNRLSVAKHGHESSQKNKLQPNVKRKRSSAERLTRVSLAPGRSTPSKFLTPNQNKYLAVPSAQFSRGSIDTVRSSIGGKSGSSSWPLNEPSFKTSLIDKILEFLVNNQCQLSVNRQMLRSPKGSDFVAIFTFIYSHLCRDYKMTARVEEEIPKILKKHKYPLQIPKSSFLNVGSPHTWPSILAMLAWLIDLINLVDVVDPIKLAYPKDFEEEVNPEEVKFYSLIDLFHSGGGEEEIAQHLSEYQEVVEKEENIAGEDFEKTERELKAVVKKLESIDSVADHLQAYEEKYEKLCEDKGKILNYIEDMKEHICAKDRERAQIDTNLDDLKEQEKQVVEQIHVLEDLKSQQKLTTAELNMHRNHKQELAIQMNHLDMEKKITNEQIWSLEMETGKCRNRLSEFCIQYNNISDEQQFSSGRISICNLEEAIPIWKTEIASDIKTEKEKAKERGFSLRNCLVESKTKIGKMQEMLNNTECEKHKLECKQKRLKEENEFLRKEQVEQEKCLNAELESVGDQIAMARRMSTLSLHELQARLEEVQREYEECKARDKECRQTGNGIHEKVRQEIRNTLEIRNQSLTEVKQFIDSSSWDAVKKCEGILEAIKKL